MARGVSFPRLLQIGLSVRGWSTADLATRAGLSPSHCSRIVHGSRQADPGLKLRMFEVLGFPREVAPRLLEGSAPSATDLRDLWSFLMSAPQLAEVAAS